MKIFLSFASEQSRVAESIYRKLLAQGYKVFFASDEIRASDHYDDVIRREIKGAGRLVFLASPESLTEGRYTLTELRMFSSKGECVSSNITLEKRSRNSGTRRSSSCEATPPGSVWCPWS